jgi:Domain of unknown function (DUF4126)
VDSQTFLSLLVGVGLAAACGFRVFVPPLVMSLAARAGHLQLGAGFEWIASGPALTAFAGATVLEIAGYFIPYVDHILDVLGAPAAVVAGTLVTASSVIGMSPFLRWSLAIIAGGGLAAVVHAATGATRAASLAATGGLGNPAVAAAEAGGSTLLSVLAIATPVAAFAVLALLVLLAWRLLRFASRAGRAGTRA